jgi:hypothetical protein
LKLPLLMMMYFDGVRKQIGPELFTTSRLRLPVVVQAAQSLVSNLLLISNISKFMINHTQRPN